MRLACTLAHLAAAAMAAAAPLGPTVEIAPGVHMPWLADGAIGFPNNTLETAGLEAWLAAGGRSVDTAQCYQNQAQVGYALGNTTIPRESIFVITKIPCVGTAALALQFIQSDLAQLNTKQVDLVLIHAPGGSKDNSGCGGVCKTAADRQATYKGLEQALAMNLTRSIGVSNFRVETLQEILKTAMVRPAVNQCSMHIGGHDDTTIAFCKAHGITYQAYSPLGGADLGGKSIMGYEQVKSIAAAHKVSGAAIGLRWVLQQRVPAVTATDNPSYIKEDLSAVDGLELTQAEMDILSAINTPPPATE